MITCTPRRSQPFTPPVHRPFVNAENVGVGGARFTAASMTALASIPKPGFGAVGLIAAAAETSSNLRLLYRATWREGVAEVPSASSGEALRRRPASVSERRALAERRQREQRETRDAEFFRIAAASVAEHILDELPEAVSERFGPTQLLLDLRAAHRAALLAIYRNFRECEPQLAAALVYAGERAWQRLSTRLAGFIVAGAEVPRVA